MDQISTAGHQFITSANIPHISLNEVSMWQQFGTRMEEGLDKCCTEFKKGITGQTGK